MSNLTSVMCTDAPIGLGHGGGSSSLYQLRALQAKTSVQQIVQMANDLGHYQSNPFWRDYLSAGEVEVSQVDVAMFNGSPWGITQKMLNAHLNIADCPAHRLAESMKECQNVCGFPYPFVHQYDEFLWPLYSQHIRAADIVITQSQQSIRWLDELGVKPQRAVVIPGGCIPPETVAPYPSGEFRVAYCGALGWDKGVTYLIDAWLNLCLKDGKLVLAGAGTESVKQALRNQSSIECLGWLPSLNEVYDSCSVYVQPSVTEGFGLTVLEAMAHGRPVIVSVGAGVHELIEDGVDGIKVGVRDIKGIAEAIDHLRRNPDKAAAMGQAARAKALQWTWDRAQASYEALIP